MALSTSRILRASSLAARSSAVPEGAPRPGESPDDLGTGFPPGRLVELCAAPDAAQTSTAARVLRAAQAEGDPVAWIVPSEPGGGGAGLYPPDLAAAGLDLDALLVVHVAPSAIARAAELVLRTGAFGAVVVDLSGSDRAQSGQAQSGQAQSGQGPSGQAQSGEGPSGQAQSGQRQLDRGQLDRAQGVPRGTAWQGRLLGLAREHACRVIVLSPNARTRASLGPLVSLRFDVRRTRVAEGRFRVDALVVKDKLGIATEQRAAFAGPVGAR